MRKKHKAGFTPPLRIDSEADSARAGFTLVEMMLVVIIIGILAAMVVPRLAGKSNEARNAAARTDIEANLSAAFDLYEMNTSSYPSSEDGLQALLTKPTDPDVAVRWKGPYLKKKPLDPWGHPYIYQYPSTHGMDFDLYSYGKDCKEGGGDDINNWESSEAPAQ